MKQTIVAVVVFLAAACSLKAEKQLVTYVNPFLGTAPLTNSAEIGFKPPWRVWAGLTFPGSSVPNAMVQLSPITKFGSGAGYEYENNVIHAFAHSNKGHWNLCNIPILPITGDIDSDDFGFFSAIRTSRLILVIIGFPWSAITSMPNSPPHCDAVTTNIPIKAERISGWW
jgi:Glycosyl hydrolase family 92 N-terminal domain